MKSLNYLSVRRLLPVRVRDSHKGTYGRALIIAGSENMTGAGILASRACYKSGVGLVEACIPEGVRQVLQTAVPEAIVLPRETFCAGDLERFSAVLIGPGLGRSEESRRVLGLVMKELPAHIPLVADADALNLISSDEALKMAFKEAPFAKIITPHPGEAARLLGTDVSSVKEAGAKAAAELAARYNSVCVLKIVPETVADPDGRLWRNTSGNDGMATAGSGDVLAGIICGLLAQGASPADRKSVV